MATITKRATKGSPLTNDEVDANFENLNTDKLETSGGSVTGNISFGDNDKAIFGAGSDLQIYHDGSDSYIRDNAEGVLRIQGAANVQIEGANEENMAVFNQDEGVFLYYDGANTFSTTATGVNVTGTVTADGLTVDGDIDVRNSNLYVGSTSNTSQTNDLINGYGYVLSGTKIGNVKISSTYSNVNNSANLEFYTDLNGSSTTKRMNIASDGDIAFYDTSGNQKFFWDASEQKLGLGTASPANNLEINTNTTSTAVRIVSADNGIARIYFGDQSDGVRGRVEYNNTDDALVFGTNDVQERMRIDSSGRLGISTNSPTTELDVSGTITQDANLLRAIEDTIADTAVDIFIYDTRKDSDGGAWRQRTQHTSWYNETLNTATRGSRKEFPAVAVIVAEANQVTIYDGDDPTMPMWMVFLQNSASTAYLSHLLGRLTIGDMTSIAMLNGKLVVAQSFTANFAEVYLEVDFIKELSLRRDLTATSVFNNGAIAGRNGQADGYTSISGGGIVNVTAVNDVAMTVLPNAPIDSATGLPIPTIAVATNGGVSVIKDDGTVVDGPDAANLESHFIDFTPDNSILSGLYYQLSPFNYSQAGRYAVPSADKANAFTDATIIYNYNGSGNVYPWPGTNQTWQLRALASSSNRDYLGSEQLLTIVDIEEYDPQNSSMLAYVTSSYNTGWMNGDIKLATLSDTDDTDVTGTELVTNGDMSSSTGWTLGSGFTIGSGILTGSSVSNFLTASSSITTVNGQVYVASIDCLTKSAGSFRLYYHNGSGYVTYVELSGGETAALTFTASSTSGSLRVYAYNGPASGTFDNLTCRLAEEDRSVNGNGLQVFGTVTKDPVATGADLVAYTDFVSNTRYLFQPPNPDMDFGTGDFSVMLWHYHSDATLNTTIYFVSGQSTSNTWQVGAAGSDQSYLWVIGGSINARSAAGTVIEQAWTHLTYVRRNGVTEIWRNGVLIETDTDTTDVDSNEGLEIPAKSSCGDGNDLLSLLRISATAPSDEQIKKIYEDEKVLFQENAQATLYGSSDAVTALAYDDDTNLLHAGTSAGRSVFSGLRRVDNTTDAVGSAISASNGMVADD